MTKEDIIRKLTRTKLWAAVIATVCILYLAVTQGMDAGDCAKSIAAAWAAYAIAEGYIDGKREESSSNQYVKTESVTATSASQKVVEKTLLPEKEGEQHG